MSYDVSAFYVTETHLKNRLKTDVKPGGGILSGGNGPGYQTNDTHACASILPGSQASALAESASARVVRGGYQMAA